YNESKRLKYLSDVNKLFLDIILSILNIKTKISSSSKFNYSGNSTEKIISICNQAGASEYLTGQAAKSYLDEELVRKSGIRLLWMDYSGYPEYEQLYPPFEHRVSILDLIFNMGPGTRNFMKSF
ncbi:MAG: WbqC family protein, partial [Bacteroidales bacterium]|nr:WbqC family protein [Bacteroidales bacterium]